VPYYLTFRYFCSTSKYVHYAGIWGTLVIVFRLGSRAINDSEYIGQPSRFIYLPDAADGVVVATFFDGEKNDFDCCIKAGLSSVLMFI
jgi:hypothetical protein